MKYKNFKDGYLSACLAPLYLYYPYLPRYKFEMGWDKWFICLIPAIYNKYRCSFLKLSWQIIEENLKPCSYLDLKNGDIILSKGNFIHCSIFLKDNLKLDLENGKPMTINKFSRNDDNIIGFFKVKEF